MKLVSSFLISAGIFFATTATPASLATDESSMEMVVIDLKGKSKVPETLLEQEVDKTVAVALNEYKYLPERKDVRAGKEGEIIDAEILWARILCGKDCPVVTKDIKNKLWLLSTNHLSRFCTNYSGVLTFSTGVVIALTVGAVQYFGFLGPEESCSVSGTLIGDQYVVSVDEFKGYVDCQSDNFDSWGRPNSIANLTTGVLIVGLGSIAYNQLLTRRETKKNEVQDGLNALRLMYQGIAESLLREWVTKVKAIREDRSVITKVRGALHKGEEGQLLLSPKDLDTLYASTEGALLPRDISFEQIDELMNNYDVIAEKLAKILRNDKKRTAEILFPLKELTEFFLLDEDNHYSFELMILALDPKGQVFGGGPYNRSNRIARLVKATRLTNEALKSIIYGL